MKILLHTCCACCLIYPFQKLKENNYQIEGCFFNPNIQPAEEFLRRKQALNLLAQNLGVIIHYPQYSPKKFQKAVLQDLLKPARCMSCWRMRLTKSAEFGKANNFDAFTSTLLASPYQDIEAIKSIGQDISKIYKIDFLFADFRPGFGFAHKQAREMGLYCQNYCGCLYSLEERKQKK